MNNVLSASTTPDVMGENNITCILISMDEDNQLRAQAFSEYKDAYETMEIAYKHVLSSLDEDEYEKEGSYINKDHAFIETSENGYGWDIIKTFVQTPEMSLVRRQYDEMISSAEKGARYDQICRSIEFRCPAADAFIYANYNTVKGIMWFSVCNWRPDQSEQIDFIPYEAYKWCVERGIIKVSEIREARRVLSGLDRKVSHTLKAKF